MSKWSSTSQASNARWVCLLVLLLTFGWLATPQTILAHVASVPEIGGLQDTTGDLKTTSEQEITSDSEKEVTPDPAAAAKVETVSMAIINAIVHTMERDGTLEQATVLLSGERIVAVGRDLAIPEGATVVDANGLHLTPGLIDVRSRLFLGDGSGDQVNDGSLDAMDGLDRFDPVRFEVVSAGVTTVYLQPSGSYGGFGAAVSTGSAKNADGSAHHGVLNARAAAQMALIGTSAETSRARKQRYEALRKRFEEARDYQKAWDEYRAALAKFEAASKEPASVPAPDPVPTTDAKPNQTETPAPENRERPTEGRGRRRPGPPNRESQQDRDGETIADGMVQEPTPTPAPTPTPTPRRRPGNPQEPTPTPATPPVTAPTTAGHAAETPSTGPAAAPKKPDFDAAKERLLPVLKRELAVRFEVHRAEEIQWALTLAADFNLRLILEGLEDMKSASQLVQDSQQPVVLGPWLSLTSQTENRKVVAQWSTAFAATSENPLGKNRVVIASFAPNAMGSKWLRYHAAAAVSAGLSDDQALRGMTIEAAHVAGIADQVGSIKVGKFADLVLFSGQPTDSRSKVAMVIQRGTPVVDRIAEVRTAVGDNKVALPTKAEAAAQSPFVPVPLPSSYVLVSQRVLFPDGHWQPAAIVVKDKMISAVSSPQEIPPGLRVFDLGDRPVTPGLQSAWVVQASGSDPIAKESDAAQQFAADGFDPEVPQIRRMLDSGLTSIHLVNAPTNVIAGQSVWQELSISDSSLGKREPAAEQWSLSATARQEERYPATLVGQTAMVRNRLAGQLTETTLYLPESVLQKLAKQKAAQLEAVQSGALAVFVDARTDAEMDAALRLVAGTKVQAWLCRPNQLRTHMQRLVDSQVGAVVLPADQGTYDWYFQDLVAAHAAGVRLLLGGDDGDSMRITASALVNAGLEPAIARRLLTMDAAKVLANGKPVGLVPGAAANWLVWSDDPLDVSSQLLWHSRGQ
ncbi:MAG: amidohydrolase family protein [Planctomycetaceae bacterium]|nr:amidohydrolase family protein [Planctomycetaceae bacterium]